MKLTDQLHENGQLVSSIWRGKNHGHGQEKKKRKEMKIDERGKKLERRWQDEDGRERERK